MLTDLVLKLLEVGLRVVLDSRRRGVLGARVGDLEEIESCQRWLSVALGFCKNRIQIVFNVDLEHIDLLYV